MSKSIALRRKAAREKYHERIAQRKELAPEDRRKQELLSFDDLRMFGIPFSRGHLYKLIKAGKFPRYLKLGERRVAFAREDIIAWIEKRKAA